MRGSTHYPLASPKVTRALAKGIALSLAWAGQGTGGGGGSDVAATLLNVTSTHILLTYNPVSSETASVFSTTHHPSGLPFDTSTTDPLAVEQLICELAHRGRSYHREHQCPTSHDLLLKDLATRQNTDLNPMATRSKENPAWGHTLDAEIYS